MTRRPVALLIAGGLLAVAPLPASARPHPSGGYFSAPSAYRIASISYTTSAVRVDHDTTTGDVNFLDTQSTTVTRRPGSGELGAGRIVAPIAGTTTGTD